MAEQIKRIVSDEFMQELRNSITEHLTAGYEELREAHNELAQELQETKFRLAAKTTLHNTLEARFEEVKLAVGSHPLDSDEEVVACLRKQLKTLK